MGQVTEHSCVVAAPADVVYDLIADVTRWPVIFGPSVHVEYLEAGPREERFRLWAWAGGEVRNWVSRRALDPAEPVGGRISFEQEETRPPMASMSGEWSFRPLTDGATEVVLVHRFTPVDDDPGASEWISRALEQNSVAELDALRRVAELGRPLDEIVFSFDDTVEVDGPVADAYEFVYRAADWPERLPHVRRVALTEDRPGVQELEMDTVTPDGTTHTTSSVRLCLDDEIVYKQLTTPSLMFGHSGSWTFAGSRVTARHTVAIDPGAVAGSLGRNATPAAARTFVRESLSAGSRATLASAKDYVEAMA